MRGRRLSAEETALWARVIASVAPLEGRAVQSPPTPLVPSDGGRRSAVPEIRPSTTLGTSERIGPQPSVNTLDGSWDRKLTRGAVQPDFAVDLHGHTLNTAYHTLDAGLERAKAQGARVLLLVTGKPREPGSGRGAIRAAVGDWLASSRHAHDIAAVRGAHPRHGGTGALYIILKRRRP